MDKKYSRVFVGIFISFIFTANPLLAQGSGAKEESKSEILPITQEKVVSPQGARCWRAEVIVVNNRIFLAFNNSDANPRSFQLVELNEDLSYQGPIIDLFSDSAGRKFPTDIRPTDIRLARAKKMGSDLFFILFWPTRRPNNNLPM